MRKIVYLAQEKDDYRQMSFLFSSFSGYEKILITKYIEFQKENINFSKKYPFSFFKTIKLIYKYKPDFLICMGTFKMLPCVFITKLFKGKVIYIENYESTYRLSFLGKVMKHISNLFIVQSDILKEKYPNSIYDGWTL